MSDYYDIDGDTVSHEEMGHRFKEWLDDAYEPMHIGDLTYYAGDVLRSTDPIAFRCGVCDYVDAEIRDGELFESWEDYAEAYPEDAAAAVEAGAL